MVNKRERKIEKLFGVPSGRPRKLRMPPVEPGMHKGQSGGGGCMFAGKQDLRSAHVDFLMEPSSNRQGLVRLLL